MKKIGITLLTAFVGGAVAVGAYKLVESKYADGRTLEEKQQMYFASNPTNITSSVGAVDFVPAAAAVTPAVVHIKTTYTGQSSRRADPFEDMFDDFFGGRSRRQAVPVQASGSGVIISDDGYIVTNNHVVEEATKIDVILPDKRQFQAKVIGRDPNTDLALIKVNASGLPIVKLGNSDAVKVGEWVLAVGYPFSLNTTVTAGIVSAKGRNIGILDQPSRNYPSRNQGAQASTAIESFIQTDAAINRGNSGGALVNTSGELIGINAAIASQSGNYEGYGFAIPINLAKKILNDFKEYGTVKRGYLGITFPSPSVEDKFLEEKGIKPGSITGVYISGVQNGSAASNAGLKEGDIIKAINGNSISSSAELMEQVGRHRPGDKLQLTYIRDGKEKTTSVTLKGEDSIKLASGSSRSAEELFNKLGASFAPASNEQKQRYKIASGVVVTEVRRGGFFDQFDIPKGTIITSINGKAIGRVDDIDAALGATKDNMVRIDGIAPDGSRVRYNFQVG